MSGGKPPAGKCVKIMACTLFVITFCKVGHGTVTVSSNRIFSSLLFSCRNSFLSVDQEKDLKALHESMKQDMKLMKQGVDMLPKEVRKDAFQKKKEEKEIEQQDKVGSDESNVFQLLHFQTQTG